MKRLSLSFSTLLIVLTFTGAWLVSGQGSLTPPGAPAPTMKTLEQIEPRTPISALPFTISQPGSYYLTTNLTGVAGNVGISITASDVTVDLNGFVLAGVPGSLAGILVSGSRNNIEVRNGTIRDWIGSGVDAAGAGNSNFSDLRIYSNGWAGLFDPAGFGLKTGNGSLVKGCVAKANNLGGIYIGSGGTVSECSSLNNAGVGITTGTGCTISGCTTQGNGSDGISAGSGNTVRGCTAQNNTGNGISAGDHCTVAGCNAALNAKDGIKATQACFLRENTCRQNGVQDGAGIHATGNGNRIEDNHLWGGTRGLDIDGTGNHVANNTVLNNSDNYDLAAANQLNLLLCEVPESLDWSCSVKLAGTLTCSQTGANGITVAADDVTIDLDGHALIGPGADSGSGIYQASTLRNLTVLSGKVSGWRGGGEGGIRATGIGNDIHGIQATTNHYGIYSGKGSLITECTANGNTIAGFSVADGSTVNNCSSFGNSTGFHFGKDSTASGCSALANLEDGVVALDGCTLTACAASENGKNGFSCYFASITIKDCTARRNTENGITVSSACLVTGNTCGQNSGAGIHVTGSHNRIEGNTMINDGDGIKVDGDRNFIVRNTARGIGPSLYVIASGNFVGFIVSPPVSGVISGAESGAGVGTTDPWANFRLF